MSLLLIFAYYEAAAAAFCYDAIRWRNAYMMLPPALLTMRHYADNIQDKLQ